MMRPTRRRIEAPVMLGLAATLGLPALAEAQSQLFPNRNINRQREACAAEPPFYSQVRRNYFGYYPTCWSKFPDGWGCPCPNPELPNRAYAFEKQPRDPLPDPVPAGEAEDMTDEPAGPAARPGDDAGLPAVPGAGGRSPFDLDRDAAPPDNVPRRNLPDAGGPRSSRGRTPAPIDRSNANPATSATARPADAPPATVGLLDMPRIAPPVAAPPLDEPGLDAGNLALAPDATLTSAAAPAATAPARADLGALPTAPTPPASTPIAGELSADPMLLNPGVYGPNGTPAQAPQRKGLLSGLFSGSKRRR